MSELPAHIIRHDHGPAERRVCQGREPEVKIGADDELADGRSQTVQDHRVGHRDPRMANQPDSIGPTKRRRCEVRGLRRIIGAQVSDTSVFKPLFYLEQLRL